MRTEANRWSTAQEFRGVTDSCDDPLLRIRYLAERFLTAAGEALDEPLADAENADSPEARSILTGTVAATKRLRDHLDAVYDFSGGSAEPKGEPCPDLE